MNDFQSKLAALRQQHEQLLTRENRPVQGFGNGIYYLFNN